MITLKCKMCGGDLHYTTGEAVCSCEFCGTKQTVVAVNIEKKILLLNRANELRLKNELDKSIKALFRCFL